MGFISSRKYEEYEFFFFFQAEDGIRDYKVTGVQTCASSDLQPQEIEILGIYNSNNQGKEGRISLRIHQSSTRTAEYNRNYPYQISSALMC